MDWKEFFKPTKIKILTSIIILILFVPFINYDNGIRCIKAPCPADTTGSITSWLISSYNHNIYQIQYINLLLGIIISYLVSCLIIYLVKKKDI
ncbi:MAG: hypothetical protein KKF89_06170, partial [Nanoarchaeota archaeon]|nr:hypothetical protein [Nanoarchaeota archaeon]MBU1855285.1 hypothetical protein [Nanoarchaeota archaeon]